MNRRRQLVSCVHIPTLSLALVFGLAGCHHKQTLRPTLPIGALAPIPLETIPPPESPLMIATLPPPEPQPLPPPPPPKPAPRRRPAPKEEPQPPVQLASAAEPAASAIGTLSTGGAAAPESRQQAQDLIASILRQIAGLPANIADAQRKQVRQIRNFIDQAKKALNSGDAEGAKNLATKAELLLDNLQKK